MRRILVGIDPGVETGLAIWDRGEQAFIGVITCGIYEAMEALASRIVTGGLDEIRFEDARLRKWFPEVKNSPEAIKKLQGAGSVKRDSAIWQEFCEFYEDYDIKCRMIAPADVYKNFPLPPGCRKWLAKDFKRMTGWQGRTSQHARDAAALVFGV